MTLVHLGKSVTTIEAWNVGTLWGGMKVVLIVNTVSQTQNLPQLRNSQHAQNYDQL
jgi:hypothetical protein